MYLGMSLGLPGQQTGKPELLANGTFDSDISGWSQVGSGDITVSWNAGRLRAVRNGAGTLGLPTTSVTTIPGVTYRWSIDVFLAQISFRIGSISLGTQYANQVILANNTGSGTFVATGATAYIALWPNSPTGTSEIDNVSIRRA